MAYIRKFKTGSGAIGVQVCWKKSGKVVRTCHVGSANSEEALARLMKKAQGIIEEGQTSMFDLTQFETKK